LMPYFLVYIRRLFYSEPSPYIHFMGSNISKYPALIITTKTAGLCLYSWASLLITKNTRLVEGNRCWPLDIRPGRSDEVENLFGYEPDDAYSSIGYHGISLGRGLLEMIETFRRVIFLFAFSHPPPC
jgi:hypothetical protein